MAMKINLGCISIQSFLLHKKYFVQIRRLPARKLRGRVVPPVQMSNSYRQQLNQYMPRLGKQK